MWDHVISLGLNCEVSFQIKRFIKNFEASLFSWAYLPDADIFIDALNHVEDICKGDMHFLKDSDDAFEFENYKFRCHGRVPRNKMFDEDGNIISQENYDIAVKELRSRVGHLASKFKRQLKTEKSTVFIRTIKVKGNYEGTVRFIHELNSFFENNYKSGKYLLVIVVEAEYYDERLRASENEHVCVRPVEYFARTDDTLDGADQDGWETIFKELILVD